MKIIKNDHVVNGKRYKAGTSIDEIPTSEYAFLKSIDAIATKPDEKPKQKPKQKSKSTKKQGGK